MQYKVRNDFYVHLGDQVALPGTVMELTPEEFELVAHQVDPIEAPKAAAKKVKADVPSIDSKEVKTNGIR
jgi:hypothetical protein